MWEISKLYDSYEVTIFVFSYIIYLSVNEYVKSLYTKDFVSLDITVLCIVTHIIFMDSPRAFERRDKHNI